MKNIKIIFVLLIIGIWFTSCSSEENNQNKLSNEMTESYELLAQELATYNAAFYESHNIPQTKGFLKKLWNKIKGFVAADATGAYIGGALLGPAGAIGGAVINSALAGSAINESMNMASPSTNEFIVARPYQITSEKGIGYLHNLIISNIEKENPGIYNQSISAEEMSKLVMNQMKAYNYPISDEDMTQLVNKAKEVLPTTVIESTDELIQHYKNLLPEYSTELNLLGDFIDYIEPIAHDPLLIKEYYNGYKETIYSSPFLRIEQVQRALLGIEVAASSAVLWNIQE